MDQLTGHNMVLPQSKHRTPGWFCPEIIPIVIKIVSNKKTTSAMMTKRETDNIVQLFYERKVRRKKKKTNMEPQRLDVM